MSQTREVRGVATSIRTEDGWTHIRYHNTDVVSFNNDEIVLRTGGYRTATTRTRMNQAANQFGLGFRIHQSDFAWFVNNNPFGGPAGYEEHRIPRRLV